MQVVQALVQVGGGFDLDLDLHPEYKASSWTVKTRQTCFFVKIESSQLKLLRSDL